MKESDYEEDLLKIKQQITAEQRQVNELASKIKIFQVSIDDCNLGAQTRHTHRCKGNPINLKNPSLGDCDLKETLILQSYSARKYRLNQTTEGG